MHGRGIAAAAMRECLAWMAENGFCNCTAEVFDENSRARKFYRKLGFREVAHVPNVRRKSKGELGGEYVIQKQFAIKAIRPRFGRRVVMEAEVGMYFRPGGRGRVKGGPTGI